VTDAIELTAAIALASAIIGVEFSRRRDLNGE
jgi:hypothetical protein